MKIEPDILRGISVTILFIAYLALWRYKRKTLIKNNGIDPEILYKDERPSQHLFSIVANILTIILIGLLVSHSIGIKDIPGFYYIIKLPDVLTAIIGLTIGILGLSICFIAQKTMGASWRVGIDKDAETNLVANGIYLYSRNPTYLGLFLVCAATFFIFPTMSFLIWVVIFILILEFQVRLEEEYLSEKHGEAYSDYCKDIKRYIPWIY